MHLENQEELFNFKIMPYWTVHPTIKTIVYRDDIHICDCGNERDAHLIVSRMNLLPRLVAALEDVMTVKCNAEAAVDIAEIVLEEVRKVIKS